MLGHCYHFTDPGVLFRIWGKVLVSTVCFRFHYNSQGWGRLWHVCRSRVPFSVLWNNESCLSIILGSAGPQPLSISHSYWAEFSVKSLFGNACSQIRFLTGIIAHANGKLILTIVIATFIYHIQSAFHIWTM